jgi:hypothetical protein
MSCTGGTFWEEWNSFFSLYKVVTSVFPHCNLYEAQGANGMLANSFIRRDEIKC